jgi:hypothetical protein
LFDKTYAEERFLEPGGGGHTGMTEFEVRLHDYLKDRPDLQNNGFEFRASAVGECPRLMDYQYQDGKADIEKPQAERMLIGHAVHDMWQEMVGEMYGDDFIGVEKAIEIPFDVDGEEHYISGHPDGILKPYHSVYELKSCSDYTFQAIKRDDKPFDSHRAQANLYAWALSLPMILFHYYNRNTGESLFFEVPTSAELAAESIEKFAQRVRNKKLGVIEERPYTDQSSTPCWYCERKTQCYEGFSDQVNSGVDLVTDDPEVLGWVESINQARSVRLNNESLEKDIKARLAKWMISGCIKTLRAGDSIVNVTVGKNNNPLISIKENK